MFVLQNLQPEQTEDMIFCPNAKKKWLNDGQHYLNDSYVYINYGFIKTSMIKLCVLSKPLYKNHVLKPGVRI